MATHALDVSRVKELLSQARVLACVCGPSKIAEGLELDHVDASCCSGLGAKSPTPCLHVAGLSKEEVLALLTGEGERQITRALKLLFGILAACRGCLDILLGGKNLKIVKRNTFDLASWNVRTLLNEGSRHERRTAIVARELARLGIDIAALSEIGFSVSTRFEKKGTGEYLIGEAREVAMEAEQKVDQMIK
ncbi:hypothetical protein HELRODRAFT_167649 [Helobdella robusta]|uniref:Uncharacterized protein n=1 Tax=Helobdella robusta TaxID=6412 RepID=T1EZM2_HELRO|nr:hypothetical protein HELRODRAFT_167649 [Helobdella robusta]ESO09838.1 hypothetical protein HELRODRAFT_167649 [Helobdella robusta]